MAHDGADINTVIDDLYVAHGVVGTATREARDARDKCQQLLATAESTKTGTTTWLTGLSSAAVPSQAGPGVDPLGSAVSQAGHAMESARQLVVWADSIVAGYSGAPAVLERLTTFLSRIYRELEGTCARTEQLQHTDPETAVREHATTIRWMRSKTGDVDARIQEVDNLHWHLGQLNQAVPRFFVTLRLSLVAARNTLAPSETAKAFGQGLSDALNS